MTDDRGPHANRAPGGPDRPAPGADGATVEELVVAALERFETEGERALEAVLALHPGHAAALRERFEALRATGLLALARERAAGEFPERLGDFRLLRRLGEGGMGVVYLAEQVSLGREVALKLVRPEGLWMGGARERFRREVEAVARLAHRSIVPIHTVGEENGLPFYAMEYVPGVSLAEALAHFEGSPPARLAGADLEALLHARGGPGSASRSGERARFEGGWVEACISIAREVAEALAHAHERGVLHRDVKPSNVMLAPSGRVLLFDFGLAALAGSSKLTRSGAQLGSLAYMAPEQVDGRADEVGPATDVHALGVTLYEMLTLRLPYRGVGPHEIAGRIRAGAPEPPRRLNPAVPSDVETLVLTALDPDPARRYASAAALARDLSNVLELRPIEARRASVALRARRWAQRHPGWSAAIALAATLLLGGPLAYAAQERRARLEIGAQRDVAEAHLASALAAVDLMTEIGESGLAEVPQAEEARRRLLEGALGFYQRLAQEQDDGLLAPAVAAAEGRVGGLLAQLGRHAEARPALGRAIAGLEALGGVRAGARIRRALSDARMQLADALRLTGDAGAARAEIERSIGELDGFVAGLEGAHDDRVALATAHRKLADVVKQAGDRETARDELRRAAEVIAPLAARAPDDVALAVFEAGTLSRLGQVELQLGDAVGASASLARALARLAALPPAASAGAHVREQKAVTANQLAGLSLARGDFAGAREHAALAVAAAQELDREFPSSPRHRDRLAVNCATLGAVEANAGDFDAAAPHFARAAALLEDLCARFPATATYATQLSGVEISGAKLLIEAGEYEDSLALSARAIARLERVIAREPGDAPARESRELLRIEQARAAFALGRARAASDALGALGTLPDAADPLACARVAAGCAALAQADGTLEPGARAELGARCRAQAVAFLRRALERGTTSAAELAGDPGLVALSADAEFAALLAAPPAK